MPRRVDFVYIENDGHRVTYRFTSQISGKAVDVTSAITRRRHLCFRSGGVDEASKRSACQVNRHMSIGHVVALCR